MVDEFENHQARSSGDLWSEICSTLPDAREAGQDGSEQFTDCFQPSAEDSTQSHGDPARSTFSPWEPMADSEVYIASLESRLKKLKGQSSEVTSREMLRSLSRAKKECWDRFLHDVQTSELFQEGTDMDQSALEHLKRWLAPEKVAISAEELEYLLLPSQSRQRPGPDRPSSGTEGEEEDHEHSDESQSPEK
ncbi:coiled-coil domain-containing protein 32 [Denticeps clupeoides]|uniref:CCD32 protein n=1 Tax=Denticeps clupeoides TaxID=299321 RepID=A0AAY4C011_9TELE|nr:coiled-coil domain-containing protein 32 [Denticeps clupeoides]